METMIRLLPLREAQTIAFKEEMQEAFHAVEFFNEYHPYPHMPEQFDQEDGLFRFEKRMAD